MCGKIAISLTDPLGHRLAHCWVTCSQCPTLTGFHSNPFVVQGSGIRNLTHPPPSSKGILGDLCNAAADLRPAGRNFDGFVESFAFWTMTLKRGLIWNSLVPALFTLQLRVARNHDLERISVNAIRAANLIHDPTISHKKD
jgi:hypothetical protein